MACVDTMQGLHASTHKSSIGRQERMHNQRKKVEGCEKAQERLIVYPPQITAEGILCRFVVSSVGGSRSCDAMRLHTMFSGSLLTRAYLAHARSMYPWTEGAEVQKISHKGEQHPPAYAPLSCSCFCYRASHRWAFFLLFPQPLCQFFSLGNVRKKAKKRVLFSRTRNCFAHLPIFTNLSHLNFAPLAREKVTLAPRAVYEIRAINVGILR